MHFVLPEKPSLALSDGGLGHVAGGVTGPPNLAGINAATSGAIASYDNTHNLFTPPFGTPGS